MEAMALLKFGQEEQKEALKVNNRISDIIRDMDEAVPVFEYIDEKRSASDLIFVLKQFKSKTGMYLLMLNALASEAEKLSEQLKEKALILQNNQSYSYNNEMIQRALDLETSAALSHQTSATAEISSKSLKDYLNVVDICIERLNVSKKENQLTEQLEILNMLNGYKKKGRAIK